MYIEIRHAVEESFYLVEYIALRGIIVNAFLRSSNGLLFSTPSARKSDHSYKALTITNIASGGQ